MLIVKISLHNLRNILSGIELLNLYYIHRSRPAKVLVKTRVDTPVKKRIIKVVAQLNNSALKYHYIMQTSTSRVETFSDGVIAIIITIMVLQFRIPDLKNPTSLAVKEQLLKILPHFAAYIFSFIMIGILWVNHHHLFHLLQKTDDFLLGQNLFFLFWMSLIPFVTSIMGANPLLPLSTALYGIILLMTTLMLALMRTHTIKKGLVHTDEVREIKIKIKKVSLKGKNQSYIGSAVYLLSVPLAFVSVYLSFICFIIPIILFLLPAGIDEEDLANKVIEKNN